GILRTYRVYIPAMYNATLPVPLLFNLHGYGSNNVEQEIYGNFRPIADTAGFIVVHPNGTLDALNKRFWNTFGGSTVDDIGFISALIDTISSDFNIDQNRIYSTGMSNGGFMSYELACGLSVRIAAIASVAGSMIYSHMNSCGALHPTPVMEIHGTADGTVPYEGTALFEPVSAVVDHWVQYNNCSATPAMTLVPDINLTDGCTAEHYVYNNGDSGAVVELYKIIGGGHTWPGAPFVIGVTNMDFSASAEIWRFLRKFDLIGSVNTGINNEVAKSPAFTVFPNPSQSKFTIDFADLSEKEITVTNYLGQFVQQFLCKSNHAELNNLNKGIYFVSVKTEGQVFTKKIIKY
ncbi:MAG: T9SS type A sorting domain-containing protein, partial [Bacteroidota bacterium]